MDLQLLSAIILTVSESTKKGWSFNWNDGKLEAIFGNAVMGRFDNVDELLKYITALGSIGLNKA